jgi:hypothetical protein
MVCRDMSNSLGAGDSRSWDDAVRGACITQCMLSSELTRDYGMER